MPAATRDMLWKVAGYPVSGFRDESKEREHVRKHLFSPREQWDDLGVKWRQYCAAAWDPVTSAWRDAAVAYGGTVQRSTELSLGRAGDGFHIPQGERGFPVLAAWTSTGIYACFAKRDGDPSHLATAMRRVFAGTRPPYRLQEYVEWGRWRFSRRDER
jgi:hypothetical protein